MDGLTDWFIGGGMLALCGVSIATYKYATSKIERNYQRMDEVRDDIDKKYVNRDICKILHEQTKSDIDEIKKRVECIPEIKAGIDILLAKK